MILPNYLLSGARTIVSVAILLAGIAAFAALSHKEPVAPRPESEPPQLQVETVPVALHTAALDLRTDGLVIPYREVRIATEVSGRVAVKSAQCRPGLVVRKGDVLAEIDREIYELEVQSLAAEVEQAALNLHQLEIELAGNQQLLALSDEQLQLQKSNMARVKSLSERNILTKSDLEDARGSELETTNSRTTLVNQVEQLKARRKTQANAQQIALIKKARAEVDLARTRIVAPCDGVVLSCQIEENSYVSAGSELCILEDIAAVEVRCNLRMEQLQWLQQQPSSGSSGEPSEAAHAYALPQTPVTVLYSLGGDRFEWQGTVVSYDGLGVDELTRTVPIRIRVSEPILSAPGATAGDYRNGPRTLIRGMFVEVVLHVQPRKPLLLIPEKAIQPGRVVWCVRDGKLAKAEVTIAQTKSPDVLLDGASSDLTVTDRLVVSPLSTPITGMSVVEDAAP